MILVPLGPNGTKAVRELKWGGLVPERGRELRSLFITAKMAV